MASHYWPHWPGHVSNVGPFIVPETGERAMRYPDGGVITASEFETFLARAKARAEELMRNLPTYREKRPAKIGTAKWRREQRKRKS